MINILPKQHSFAPYKQIFNREIKSQWWSYLGIVALVGLMLGIQSESGELGAIFVLLMIVNLLNRFLVRVSFFNNTSNQMLWPSAARYEYIYAVSNVIGISVIVCCVLFQGLAAIFLSTLMMITCVLLNAAFYYKSTQRYSFLQLIYMLVPAIFLGLNALGSILSPAGQTAVSSSISDWLNANSVMLIIPVIFIAAFSGYLLSNKLLHPRELDPSLFILNFFNPKSMEAARAYNIKKREAKSALNDNSVNDTPEQKREKLTLAVNTAFLPKEPIANALYGRLDMFNGASIGLIVIFAMYMLILVCVKSFMPGYDVGVFQFSLIFFGFLVPSSFYSYEFIAKKPLMAYLWLNDRGNNRQAYMRKLASYHIRRQLLIVLAVVCPLIIMMLLVDFNNVIDSALVIIVLAGIVSFLTQIAFTFMLSQRKKTGGVSRVLNILINIVVFLVAWLLIGIHFVSFGVLAAMALIGIALSISRWQRYSLELL